MAEEPLVLGIETSCDETGVGIVRGGTLLADVVASSVAEHARFGGVVPEVASRAHLEAMVPTLDRATRLAGVRVSDVDAVAVTAGPGLAGALLVGVGAAKALALSLGVPLHGVNHLAALLLVAVSSIIQPCTLAPAVPPYAGTVGTGRGQSSRDWRANPGRAGPPPLTEAPTPAPGSPDTPGSSARSPRPSPQPYAQRRAPIPALRRDPRRR